MERFSEVLNEMYEGEVKGTWVAIKNYTLNPNDQLFEKIGLTNPDYSEDLKNSISDYYANFKEQNNPLDKNSKKKADIELNCDKLYDVFNFTALSKEIEEIK